MNIRRERAEQRRPKKAPPIVIVSSLSQSGMLLTVHFFSIFLFVLCCNVNLFMASLAAWRADILCISQKQSQNIVLHSVTSICFRVICQESWARCILGQTRFFFFLAGHCFIVFFLSNGYRFLDCLLLSIFSYLGGIIFINMQFNFFFSHSLSLSKKKRRPFFRRG